MPRAARRADSLALRLEAWRPLESTRYWIGWHGGTAHVWAWRGVDDQSSARAGGVSELPESALHPPLGSGCRLVELLEGFEGQYWAGGQLEFSRWWASEPGEDQWRRFVRAAGQVPDAGRPEPARVAWRARPWARPTAPVGEWLEHNEGPFVIWAASVLALLLGWQLAGVWQAERAVARERERMQVLERQAGPELAAREQALSELDRARALVALGPVVEALPLLRAVAEAGPGDTRIASWQQFGRELEVVFEGDAPPPPEQTVRALEQIPGLGQVIAERGRRSGQLQVRAVLEAGEGEP